jgi:hypothetical protein
MSNDIHRMLVEELDKRPAPPLGDLAGDAVARGRRLRRARTARGLGAGAAALAVFVVLVTVGVTRATGPSSVGVGPSSVVAGAAPTTKLVPATSAGVLELLTRLLPAGTTSAFAVADDDPLHVQLMIDRGQGPAMIRVSIFHAGGCQSTCRPVGGGAVAATGEIPDNCIQRWRITVYHANGDAIAFDLSSCLEWNGTTNPPSPRALSDAEAIAIGANAGFGTKMPADLVAAGAQHFGTIRTINGG